MLTMTSTLAKPKRGKATHNRRWFRDLLGHFPNSNVKIGGTVCKLYQIYHFWTFFVIKSLKHKIQRLFNKEELFFGVSWTQRNLKEQNRLKNFGDIIEKRRKSRNKSSFCVKSDLVHGSARLHFVAKRLGRPFFIKRSHLSNIRVKSEGVVATAWWVDVEGPRPIRCTPPLRESFNFIRSAYLVNG